MTGLNASSRSAPHAISELDGRDPLRVFRSRFLVPERIIYLDGNSLGALSIPTRERIEAVARNEWGEGLIRSWNDKGWLALPQRVGAKIAKLIGANPTEVIAADSTSVNLFKLIAAAAAMRPGRQYVVTELG